MQKVNLNNIEKLDFRSRESYKTLRTNLEFAGKRRKVIAVTSCTPNEGKTSVSFQLALSMAESGKRVMLVDADLRKSVLRSIYKVSAARYGLSHYLSGQASLSEVLCETNVPDFYAVFAGPVPPNPSELLGSEAFGLLLEYLRGEYDYVVVDTPPLGSVIDGAVIAKQCDGAVLVIESGMVSYKFAQGVKDQLDKAGCSVLGVVLNKVNLGGNGYYGKYYGKYYGNYYGMYGADEEGGLEDAISDHRIGGGKTEKQTERLEKAERGEKTERAEKPDRAERSDRAEKGDRAEKNEKGEKTGKNSERDNRPNRKARNANRKAAQGKIMLLDEDEMDFLTLDEEIVEEKPETGREADDGKNPTGTERK